MARVLFACFGGRRSSDVVATLHDSSASSAADSSACFDAVSSSVQLPLTCKPPVPLDSLFELAWDADQPESPSAAISSAQISLDDFPTMTSRGDQPQPPAAAAGEFRLSCRCNIGHESTLDAPPPPPPRSLLSLPLPLPRLPPSLGSSTPLSLSLPLSYCGMPEGIELRGLISSGSFCNVYYGTWNSFEVAIKVVTHDESTPRLDAVVEAAIGLSLSHPNIVPTLAAFSLMRRGSGDGDGGGGGGRGGALARGRRAQPRSRSIKELIAPRRSLPSRAAASTKGAGPDAPAATFIIMGLVEGRSLRDALDDGSLWAPQPQLHGSCAAPPAGTVSAAGANSPHIPPPSAAADCHLHLPTAAAATSSSCRQLPSADCLRQLPAAAAAAASTYPPPPSAAADCHLQLPAAAAATASSSRQVPRLAQLLDLACDAADSLVYLHANGVVHGDFKAGNLLMSPNARASSGACVLLADFGQSCVAPAAPARPAAATVRGAPAAPADVPLAPRAACAAAARRHDRGTSVSPANVAAHLTLMCAAPERLRGGAPTFACDVYAFGVLLWELYTGKRPYSTYRLADFVLLMQTPRATAHALTFDARTPPAYVALCRACWASEPDDRPTMEGVADALADIRGALGGATASAAPVRFSSLSLPPGAPPPAAVYDAGAPWAARMSDATGCGRGGALASSDVHDSGSSVAARRRWLPPGSPRCEDLSVQERVRSIVGEGLPTFPMSTLVAVRSDRAGAARRRSDD
ncbi:hypothetical protein FOA52_006819 [Chlamydomonas sp. UWO 241]|nr:hypothetical protein FOA52_006819 [Chlamydomonas sp. UWO 241]